MKANQGAQFEISIDGVARTYCDKKDIALQSAQLLKSRNPDSGGQDQRLVDWRGDHFGVQAGEVIAMPLTMRPQRACFHRVLQRPRRLSDLLRRVEHRPHLRNPQRARTAALVLGAALSRQAREPAHQQSAGSLEAAKEEFEECWRKWKAWAGLEELP
jgi:hypothetical protein